MIDSQLLSFKHFVVFNKIHLHLDDKASVGMRNNQDWERSQYQFNQFSHNPINLNWFPFNRKPVEILLVVITAWGFAKMGFVKLFDPVVAKQN